MQIKETMQRYGYSPTSLAKKMGVYASTVIRLTEGNPTVDKLDELARWIGCSRWEFFKDEIEAAGYHLTAGPAPQPQEKEEASLAEEQHDELPFSRPEGGQPKEQASEKATSEQVLRFSYDCPHCGHEVRITIE